MVSFLTTYRDRVSCFEMVIKVLLTISKFSRVIMCLNSLGLTPNSDLQIKE